MNFFKISQMENGSIPMGTLSSARKYVRKHGLRVMKHQMEGIVTSLLNLLFVIKPGILRFSRF